MKKRYLLMPFLALALASCSNDAENINAPSALNVKAGIERPSRAMITDKEFGDGQTIGVSLLASDGTKYDNQTTGYTNVKYTSSGTGNAQTWTSTTPIMLSASTGKAAAVYPWTDNASFNLESIALETTTQTDYMYSAWIPNLSNSNTTANFVMDHALTAICVDIQNDSYSGDGKVNSVTIQSKGLATEGTLNVVAGTVTETAGTIDQVIAMPVAADDDIANGGKVTYNYMLVPTGDNENIVVTIKMDNKTYSNTVQLPEAAKSGYIYTIKMSAKNNSISVMKVSINEWKDGGTVEADMEIQ